MIVLALDPSFTEFGGSIVDTSTNIVLDSFVIQTKKIVGPVSESDTRRLNFISSRLHEKCRKYGVEEIWSEAIVGSKSASAAKALCFCKGLLIGLAQGAQLPLKFCSAKNAKKALTGDSNAEKDVVKAAVIKELGETAEKVLNGPKYAQEAVGDSLAVYLYFSDHGTQTSKATTNKAGS